MKDMIKRIREEKGGFTLAELLIVVAIILVLVAIAVPVFTGSLQSAEDATEQANVQIAKTAAMPIISGDMKTYGKVGDADAVAWTVTATVKPGGDVTITKIEPSASELTGTSTASKDENGTWTVTAYMNQTELKTQVTPPAGA